MNRFRYPKNRRRRGRAPCSRSSRCGSGAHTGDQQHEHDRELVEQQRHVDLESADRDPLNSWIVSDCSPPRPSIWTNSTTPKTNESSGGGAAEQVAPGIGTPAAQQQDRRGQAPVTATSSHVSYDSSRAPQYFSRLASSTEAERRVRNMATMIASPTTTSAAATTITKKAVIWPSRLPAPRAKATNARLRRVEHQLDAHEHHDGVAPDQHPERADTEQQRGQHDVVARYSLRPHLGSR